MVSTTWLDRLRALLKRLPPEWRDLPLDQLLDRLRLDLDGGGLNADRLRLTLELLHVLRDMLESELARRKPE